MAPMQQSPNPQQQPAPQRTQAPVQSSPTELQEMLLRTLRSGASDLHLVPGHPPMLRIHTRLVPIEGKDILKPEQTIAMAREMLGDGPMAMLAKRRDLDFSTHVKDMGRFRVNAHFQRDMLAIAFRSIVAEVPRLSTLNLPPVVERFTDLPRGLVLVTGATGSGKSTTLASLIGEMNLRIDRHVITLEDPIEYLIVSRACLIEQREVGSDVTSFSSGLRHALRQDPDVILVGEMRDLETTSAAITAAETGHLVLSTLHTQGASQTLARIIDIYPAEQQNQIRSMLANTLQAVVTQTLFRRMDGRGMIPGCEVMVCNSAVRNCIRENRIHEIPNIIETSRSEGMIRLDESIKGLVVNNLIDRNEGLSRAQNPVSLARALGR